MVSHYWSYYGLDCHIHCLARSLRGSLGGSSPRFLGNPSRSNIGQWQRSVNILSLFQDLYLRSQNFVMAFPLFFSFEECVPHVSLMNLQDLFSVPPSYIFLAVVPAAMVAGLYFFDHSVASQMAQQKEFNLKNPSAYHYDILILSLTVWCIHLFWLFNISCVPLLQIFLLLKLWIVSCEFLQILGTRKA